MVEWFDKHDDEFLKFKNIPAERRLSTRPDLCAFLLLDKLVSGNSDIVAAAEHDEIFLETSAEDVFLVATEDDIITLIRCGVRYDKENDSFAMFA